MRRWRSLIAAAVLAVVACAVAIVAAPGSRAFWEELAGDVWALGGATIAGAPIAALFISFMAYSFLGWLFESTVCSLSSDRRFINRGFLLGPYCPIYGTGGLACWLLLRGIDSVPLLFVTSAVVCCCIEYTVGWVLEKATKARFWDYSGLPFNIHGRVCLYGALLFGAGCTLLCRVVQPVLLYALSLLPSWATVVLAVALLVLLVTDVVSSISSWRRLSGTLDALRDDLAKRTDETLASFSERMLADLPEGFLDSVEAVQDRARRLNDWLAASTDSALEKLRERWPLPAFVREGQRSLKLAAERFKPELSKRDLRFFNAFPSLRIKPYEGIIRATGLKERARELWGKRPGK